MSRKINSLSIDTVHLCSLFLSHSWKESKNIELLNNKSQNIEDSRRPWKENCVLEICKNFEIEHVLNLVCTSTLFSDKTTPALTQISLILDNAHPF